MTQIDFFSNAPNRLDYVVRLLKKVRAAEQTAVVYGAPAMLDALSDALWQLDGFFAHDVHHAGATSTLLAPVVLISDWPDALPHYAVLVNLSDEIPAQFASFTRLIEVVPNDDAPRQAARERWAHYKERGYPMTHHDIARK
ncbi:MAG: DNA polymerase III subunit chi [Formosimonas sp.]